MTEQIDKYIKSKSQGSNYDYYAYKESSDYFLKLSSYENKFHRTVHGLGHGWRFNLPSIEVSLGRHPVHTYRTGGFYFLRLEDGRTLRIIEENGKARFDDHKLTDVTIAKVDDQFIVTYADGRKACFAKSRSISTKWDHVLTYMEDRFGNRITFEYDSATGRMQKITDTYGRVVLLEMNSATNTLSLRLEGESTPQVQYVVMNDQLTQVIDKANRITKYSYSKASAHLKKCSHATNDQDVYLPYHLLTKVEHPTGARTEYTYGSYTGYFEFDNDWRTRQRFVLKTRADYSSTTSTDAINYELYEYVTKGKGFTMNGDTLECPIAIYIKQTTVKSHKASANPAINDYQVIRVHNFSNEHRQDSEITKHIVGGAEKIVANKAFTYNDFRLPSKEETKLYDYAGNMSRQAVEWAYDSKGNVTQQKQTFYTAATGTAVDASLSQQTDTVYDSTYSIPTSVTVANSDGTIVEQSILTADKKLIAEKRILHKGVLKERTGFIYDAENRLISQKRYYASSAAALAVTTDCYETKYHYNDAYLTSQPAEEVLLGIMDAPEGLKKTFTYDQFGRVLSRTDENGNCSRIQYDGLNRVIKETNPDGSTKQIQYHDAYNQITSTNELGYQKRLEYTSLGQIAKEYLLNPMVLLRSFAYDNLLRPIQETSYFDTGAVKAVTNYTYSIDDQIIQKTITNVAGEVFSQENMTLPVYTANLVYLSKTILGDETAPSIVTEGWADRLGRTVKETIKGASTAEDTTVSYTYDLLGNKLTQTDARGYTTTWTYDHAARVLTERNALGNTVTTAYDALGNKISTTDANGNTSEYIYDAAGRVIEQKMPYSAAAKMRTRFAYDPAGNLLEQLVLCSAPGEPESWKKTRKTYDNRNRVVDTILYEQDNTENRTRIEYDAIGNKTAIWTGLTESGTTGATVTRYRYNCFGNIIEMVDARSNELTASEALYKTETSQYDNTGRLLSKTDRNGAVIRFQYDILDRIVEQSASNDLYVKTTFTLTGHTKTMENNNICITNTYDCKGQLFSTREDPVHSASKFIYKQFAYDKNGNRTGLILRHSGSTIYELGYVYDAVGHLTTVTRSGNTFAQYSYDANGNRTGMTYAANDTQTTYSYNNANLITKLTNTVNGVVKSSYTYTYYLDGNQRDKTELNGDKTSYIYDNMGRLITEATVYTDPDDGGTVRTTYTYDRFGNRAAKQVENGGNKHVEHKTTYHYHPNNWLLEEVTVKDGGETTETVRYRYDANGNQVYKRFERLEKANGASGKLKIVKPNEQESIVILDTRKYNEFGQLTEVYRDGERSYYSYRPDGLRHGKIVSGADRFHVWDGQHIAADITKGVISARYYYGANLISWQSDGYFKFYLFNAHGDVQHVVQGNNVLYSYDYDAFGNEKSPAAKYDGNPLRYCGEYYDREIENVYLRARYYDTSTGRFTQEDPIRDGFNWFYYCNYNPIKFKDSTGLCYYDENGNWRHEQWEDSTYEQKQDYRENFFTENPAYEPEKWNTPGVMETTNCYAYAFNMTEDPRNNTPFLKRSTDGFALQPGQLSGEYEKSRYSYNAYNEYLKAFSGSEEGNEKLVNMITKDMETIGIDFIPYAEGLTGGYKVALVIAPNNDYHWYRENGDGTWSHKPGETKVTNLETWSTVNGIQYGDIIKDPKKAGEKAGYSVYVGTFYVKVKSN